MANINFTLEFGNKNVLVKFNPDPRAKEVKIGLNGESYKSVAFCNAIGEVINVAKPNFKVREAGMYLHKTLAEAREGFEDNNVGYVLSSTLEGLLASHEITYQNEMLPNELYRVRFDGLAKVFVSLLTRHSYAEGEATWVRHDRNAYDLVKNLETLRKAETLKANIRLFYAEKEAARFTLLQTQWGMFLAGKFDELAENIQTGIDGASAFNTLRDYENLAKKRTEEGKPFVAKAGRTVMVFGGEQIDENALVGQTIQFVARGKALSTEYPVTAENLSSITSTIKARGYQVAFVAPKDEVTELVIEPVTPKARKSIRKPAAK
jgi:hypothetical protein